MFEELINEMEKIELSFDEFLALYKIYSAENDVKKINYSSDMLNTYLELEVKGLIKIIATNNDILTFFMREQGDILIQTFCQIQKKLTDKPKQTQNTELPKIVLDSHKFEEFWMTFPTSDEHGIYKKTRILKAAKENCKKKYISLLKEGHKHEDIIKALKYEIKMRKDANNRQNNMMYMKSSSVWLNQKEFEIILETMTEDVNDNSSDDWTSNSI